MKISNENKQELKQLIVKVYKSINVDKFDTQIETIESMYNYGFKSLVEWATGVGKTMVAILFIKLMNWKDSNKNTTVVVPSKKLLEDWTSENGHINNFGLLNVQVFVVNTYTSYDRWTTDLLICDEVHQYCNPETKKFGKVITITSFKYCICLSATLTPLEREYLTSHNIHLISNIELRKAEEKGFVAPNLRFNVPLELYPENKKELARIQDIFDKSFSVFENNFTLAQACSRANFVEATAYFSEYDENTDTYTPCNREDYNKIIVKKTGKQWREFWAFVLGWNGTENHQYSPKNIMLRAGEFAYAVKERINILNKGEEKINYALNLIRDLDVKTIVFCENTSVADTLEALLLDIGIKAKAYHSNIPSEVVYKDKIIGNSVKVEMGRGKYKTMYKLSQQERERLYSSQLQLTEPKTLFTLAEIKKYFPKAKTRSKNKINEESLAKFEKSELSVLITAKALDEGADIKDLECAIILSGTSKKRQQTQREGRSVRFKKDKIALIFNLFYKGTSDEYKLRARLGQNKSFIEESNINKIKDIIKNAKSLYTARNHTAIEES